MLPSKNYNLDLWNFSLMSDIKFKRLFFLFEQTLLLLSFAEPRMKFSIFSIKQLVYFCTSEMCFLRFEIKWLLPNLMIRNWWLTLAARSKSLESISSQSWSSWRFLIQEMTIKIYLRSINTAKMCHKYIKVLISQEALNVDMRNCLFFDIYESPLRRSGFNWMFCMGVLTLAYPTHPNRFFHARTLIEEAPSQLFFTCHIQQTF